MRQVIYFRVGILQNLSLGEQVGRGAETRSEYVDEDRAEVEKGYVD
jgi:hypothetical protein